MYLNSQPVIIDFVDLLLYILKKIWVVILSGIIIAGILFGYKMYSTNKTSEINSSNIFDVSVKLPGETDVKYSERVQDVNRAIDLINSTDVLKNQIENNRKYLSDSILMKINSENEAVSTVNLIVTVNDNQISKTDLALLSTYKQYILSGEYLDTISEDIGVNQGYITELISAGYETSSISINTSDINNAGIISITVIGPTIEFTDRVMDSIIDNVNAKYNELNSSVIKHTITYATRQSSYKVDNTTRDKQYNITNRFETLQQQITNNDKAIENISTKLGIDKNTIYSYFAYNDLSISKSTSYKSLIKYAVLGFIIGAAIVIVMLMLNYIFNSKFSTQTIFFSRFNNIRKIGVMKPASKRSKFIKHIDICSGDDNKLSPETSIKLLSSDVKNLTEGMNNVLFTGTADIDVIQKLVNDIGIRASVRPSVFVDPTIAEKFSEFDGIIIVEQRNFSDCRMISEELNMINNAHVNLVGAIIV